MHCRCKVSRPLFLSPIATSRKDDMKRKKERERRLLVSQAIASETSPLVNALRGRESRLGMHAKAGEREIKTQQGSRAATQDGWMDGWREE